MPRQAFQVRHCSPWPACHWGHKHIGRASFSFTARLHGGSPPALRRHSEFPLQQPPRALRGLPAKTGLLWSPGTGKCNCLWTQGKTVLTSTILQHLPIARQLRTGPPRVRAYNRAGKVLGWFLVTWLHSDAGSILGEDARCLPLYVIRCLRHCLCLDTNTL